MKHATEMGSGVVIHVPSFLKIASGIPKPIGVDTQTAWKPLKLICIFSN
jgi:hypothetical protein